MSVGEGGGGVVTSDNNASTVSTVSQQVEPDWELQTFILSPQEILLQSKLYQAASANVGYQNPVFDLEQGVQGLQEGFEGQDAEDGMGKSRRSQWSLRRPNPGRLEAPSQAR